jgi:murein DD-endopeptidase MepM/ murein hydrolase activator NlpD
VKSLLSLLAATALLAPAACAQTPPPPPTVTAEPARPTQGTLFELRVSVADTDAVRDIRGAAAGEPLHFTPDSGRGGTWRALAAAPLEAADSLGATVVVVRRRSTDTTRVRIPVAAGVFEVEHLRVAPQFGTKPDSALQARIDREYERAQATGRLAHQTPRLWREPFMRPRPGRVTSGFGRTREFNGQVQSRHTGIDLAGAVGDPVRAANRGVVAIVDRFFVGGNVIYLDHGAGLVTAYLHLSRTNVAPGDTVARGQVIGRVGATGRVTGPHLHFIARYGTISVDPLTLPGIEK